MAFTFRSGIKAGRSSRPTRTEKYVFVYYVHRADERNKRGKRGKRPKRGYNSDENSRITRSDELFDRPPTRNACSEARSTSHGAVLSRSVVCARVCVGYKYMSGEEISRIKWHQLEFHSEDQSNQIAGADGGLELLCLVPRTFAVVFFALTSTSVVSDEYYEESAREIIAACLKFHLARRESERNGRFSLLLFRNQIRITRYDGGAELSSRERRSVRCFSMNFRGLRLLKFHFGL